jgi:hypothetical protein
MTGQFPHFVCGKATADVSEIDLVRMIATANSCYRGQVPGSGIGMWLGAGVQSWQLGDNPSLPHPEPPL